MTARGRVVIHRDHTFEDDGETYTVLQGGHKYGYSISDSHGRSVADDFETLRDVREYVVWCREHSIRIGDDRR